MKHDELRQLANDIHDSPRDAIAGELVIAHARKIDDKGKVSGTSTHNIQEIRLRKNVLCVIDRAFRYKQN